ncbi:hypothetical protein WBG78_30710 [Chryseolinea sp. T2]|uniref:hypothetical protein n=1 Tax=Chryseolinea sp. T2 TaxID=3129255 RepID=UPI00307732A6
MKSLQTLLVFPILISCDPDKKVCEFSSDNEELVIYNNILTELVENRMDGRYLGGKEEEIREKYYYDQEEVDTARIDIEFIKAHNDIFNNPLKFCTLYLDTLAQPEFYYDSAKFEQDIEFKNLITKYTDNPQGAVDSLNGLQEQYSPADFGLCTAKIDNIENWKIDSTCSFGRLRLSKIVLNEKKDKGLIFYDWHCGSIGLCGHSGIIEFIKGTKRWEIVDLKYWSVY